MQSFKDTFFSLVRLGIGHSYESLPGTVEWNEIIALANAQKLTAVVIDGVEKLQELNYPVELPEKPVLAQWISDVLRGYERRYDSYCRTINEMAAFYNGHGFKMMILKGYACSLNWPKPDHRPAGDIDIWMFGQYKESDAAVEKEKKIIIDDSHHHHTVFHWNEFRVEDHYDFVNVHHDKSSKRLETVFKQLGEDDSYFVELKGEKIYLPSPNLHSLFLIRHMISHFASTNISLRYVLDWAFFVKKYYKEIDWKWLTQMLEEYHMIDFFNIINSISVDDLGFEAAFFPPVKVSKSMKDRVLSDILYPEQPEEAPQKLIPRIIFKYRRWKNNEWKHRLCYEESMWSSFWWGIWNHLIKPKSI